MADPNPYGKTGRHHRLNQRHTEARYHLRGGIARVALEAKVGARPALDSTGRPLLYATEMAERHSVKTLEKWVRATDRPALSAMAFGMDFCSGCHRIPRVCRCR